MATTHAAAENPSAALAPLYRDLGIDAEGYHHAQDRARDVIHRVDPATGERERVASLNVEDYPARGNAIEAYVQFVAEEIGWAERVPTGTDLFDGTRTCPQHDRRLVQDAAGCLHCPECQR